MNRAIARVVRGPLLVPRDCGSVDYFADGVLAADAGGSLLFSGGFDEFATRARALGAAQGWPERVGWAYFATPDGMVTVEPSRGVMIPPLVDAHLHVPQHPIRGHFGDGVDENEPGGKLLNSLQRNVFPAEAKCHDAGHAKHVVDAFARDTLAHGVVGGCAYMMVSPRATDVALGTLSDLWSVGMVLMNQNSPEYLTTNEPTIERDVDALARKYGARCVVTDRFAVAVDSRLRARASKLAAKHGLRTQTHLNEQVGEKRFVEETLYPDARSYTHVYLDDGLLDHRCILAHCIHMRDEEWSLVRDTGSVVAHCPTSNLLLGSGTMDLDVVLERGIPYAIATDVGASPTVSMLAEMGRFLLVHAGRSGRATPAEALYRATRAPAEILGIGDRIGTLEAGRPMSFVEVDVGGRIAATAEEMIRLLIPEDLNSPSAGVARVTLGGRVAYEKAQEQGMVDA